MKTATTRTLGQCLCDAATGQAGVRFVERSEQSIFVPYADVYRGAQRAAAHLQDRGIASGDVVALILPTSLSFYEAFFGAMLLGAIPVALYPPMRLGRMDDYHSQTARSLTTVRAVVVLTTQAIRRILGETVAQAQPKYGCIAVESLSARVARAEAQLPRMPAELDAPAFMQFSSGTTQAPKPVALTHRQVGANIHAIAQRLYRDAPLAHGVETHSAVSWLPLYHDMGLVGCMLTALVERSTLTLIAPELFVARPAVWLRTISRYKASISAAPNFAYNLCAQRIRDEDLQGVDLSSWQVALNGAETVSPSTIERFAERFAPWGLRPGVMTPVYGLAEAALAVTFASPGHKSLVETFDADALERLSEAVVAASGQACVSVGTPLTDYTVRIVDDDGRALGQGRKGHIHVAGPSIVTDDAAAEGWLATGDTGFVHAGELYVVGRHKDLIIIRGRNIAPHLVETSLDAIEGVRTGCSIAVSDRAEDESTEALVLFVERRRLEGQMDDAALVRAIEVAVVGACQVKPETVVLCAPGTLPRTSSGKLRRKAALAAWKAGTLSAPDDVSWWRLGLQMLHSRAVMPRLDKTR